MPKSISVPAWIECQGEDGRTVFYSSSNILLKTELWPLVIDQREFRRMRALWQKGIIDPLRNRQ